MIHLRISLLALLAVLVLPLSASAQTLCSGGMAGAFPCSGVDLMTHMPYSSFTSPGSGAPSGANDIWGWTDAQDGSEYALVGLSNGTAFVDVTTPSSPIYLGKLPTESGSSLWRDIKTVGDYAFIVSEAGGHGMQVFDLTRLRSVANPPVTFTSDAVYTVIGSAHNIVANEASGYVYAVGASSCSGGLHMIDVSTPLLPSFAGCYSGDGYTHDAQCVTYSGPDSDHLGSEICVGANEDTITIVDVTNKSTPVQLARVSYPNDGYTHQGWFTEDQRYFVIDDELDEFIIGGRTRTIVFDMLDLDNPDFMFIHSGATNAADHNLYVHDGKIFLSNYSAGLRILDASDIANESLSEVAFFDTYPSNNNVSFNGQWSNYPFFASGTILANDINNGFFAVALAGGGDPIDLTLLTRTRASGVSGARLDWTPADGGQVDINRNGSTIATTPDDGRYIDILGVVSGSFTYEVCETDSGDCSNEVTVSFLNGVADSATLGDEELEAMLEAAESSSSVSTLPETVELREAYPNPFNPSSTLSFRLQEASFTRLVVFDATGREVARLVDGTVEAGNHEVIFDGSDLPSGVYFVRFTVGSEVAQTQRLTLLK